MNVSPGNTGTAGIENNDMIGTTIPVSMDDLLLKLKETVDNASFITGDLAAIMGNIRSGKGTIGKLFMDTVFAENLDRTIVNVKQGTKGFKQNMDAAQHSFLLRGFFRKNLLIKRSNRKNRIYVSIINRPYNRLGMVIPPSWFIPCSTPSYQPGYVGMM